MAPRRVALPVAALVLLAGCTGAGISPPNPQSDATTTTAPDPTAPNATTTAEEPDATGSGTAESGTAAEADATTAAENRTLPPGTNGTGVEDAEELVAAHSDALNRTSFGFRFQANVSVGPAVQWTVQRGSVEAGLSPLMIHSTSLRQLNDDATEVGTDLWANATDVVVRYRGEDSTELRRYNRSGGAVEAYDETWDHLPRADLESQVTQAWLIELALTVGDYRLERTERRDGALFAEFRATEPVAATNFTDLDATVLVDGEGRVHAAELTASAGGDDETRVHYEFELTDVGNASVTRPDWVGAATPPENATAGDATEENATAGDATATGSETTAAG